MTSSRTENGFVARVVKPVVISLLGLTALLAIAAAGTVDSEPPRKATVVFLVRHAEKVDASANPKLSKAGKKRAAKLVNVLRDAEITRVHSSNFFRTRDTAAPLAGTVGAKVEVYDRGNLAALADTIRKAGGRHLVVGHSTTTPRLVSLLGGKPGRPINEQGEYDRLYVLTFHPDGTTSTVLMRYGSPYQRAAQRIRKSND